jgi:hypothetical protein
MSFWSAIANFFRGFFRSVPALVTGIAVGWATWGAGPILAGILGGVTAAVVNTAINGGNWGQAIGMGAVLGGIAGGIGGDVFKGFGGIPDNGFNWGNFVAGVKTGAAFGAVIGGISTAIHGGNVFQNVAMGALSGAVSSAAAFGIMKGATEAYAEAKEWWNSMPGTLRSQAGFVRVGGGDRDVTPSNLQTEHVRSISDEGEGRNPLVDSLIKNAEKLTITATVAGKALSEPRPYAFLTQVMQEIMAARMPIPDPSVAGALRWDVLGTFAGKLGVWELVVNPRTQQIYHFLFNSDKSAVAPLLK